MSYPGCLNVAQTQIAVAAIDTCAVVFRNTAGMRSEARDLFDLAGDLAHGTTDIFEVYLYIVREMSVRFHHARDKEERRFAELAYGRMIREVALSMAHFEGDTSFSWFKSLPALARRRALYDRDKQERIHKKWVELMLPSIQ